jgi:hypothetical protein
MFQLEERPAKEILMSLNGVSYLFALLALACGIAWIYYVVKAVDNNAIGGSAGRGNDDSNGTLDASEDTTAGETRQVDTVDVMFQGVVASVLLYSVFRHHFSMSHY